MKTSQVPTSTVIKKFPGGQANMGNVGAALAPKGIKPMDFIKMFNDHEMSKKYPGVPLTVRIAYAKNFLSIGVRAPDNAHFIREAAQLKQGSKAPGRDSAGKISWDQIANIAKIRYEEDSSTNSLGWCLNLAGSARSAGIEVTGSIEDLEARLNETRRVRVGGA